MSADPEPPPGPGADDECARIEAAIAALEASRAALGDAVLATALAPLRARLAALVPVESPRPTAQRKQATVLFADISGFTAIAENMDAEEVADMVNALWSRIDGAIAAHGGRVDKHIGDAVMALWGTPVAQEDDPEQAIRAALAIQAEMAKLREQGALVLTSRHRPIAGLASLKVRIGIHTGPVLLGEVGATREFTAMGDAVNIANRLEQAAPVGEGALISADTYAQVRGIFDVLVRQPIFVKGKTAPLEVFHVRRAKPRAFRLGTRGIEGVETRMIGREEELAELQDALSAMLASADGSDAPRARMLTVVGDAGLGKSRLLHEFSKWLEILPDTIRYYKGRAGERMLNQAGALWRDLFSDRFQIQDDDGAKAVLAKMEAGVAEAFPNPADEEEPIRRAHFIGRLVGFDFSGSPHLASACASNSSEIRDTALADMIEYFAAVTAAAPTVLLLEDIHWADSSSLDIVEHLAAAADERGLRLLIVCLTRPTLLERRPRWGGIESENGGGTQRRRLILQPLSRAESSILLGEILHRKAEMVPAALRELIVGGAEGNPFYLEELIKMLIERGVIVKRGEGIQDDWEVDAGRLASVQIPPALTGVLQARLDSLSSPERLTLQRAAVVGRRFWDQLVEHLSPQDNVEDSLTLLRDREMIFQRETSTFREAREYIFKHTLLRDVAYETVLLRERRHNHQRIAEWLESHAGQRLGEYLGLIAEHFEKAGEGIRAATYLRRVGDAALRIAAWAEAENAFRHALALLPEEASNARERARLLVRLGDLYERRSDYPAANARLQEALGLAREADDERTVARAYIFLGLIAFRQGHYQEARISGEESLRLARRVGDPGIIALALRHLGAAVTSLKDYPTASRYLRESLHCYEQLGDLAGLAGCWNRLGVAAFYQQDYPEAARNYEKALELAEQCNHQQEICNLLGNLGEVAFKQGDMAKATRQLEECLALARELGNRGVESIFMLVLSDVHEAKEDFVAAERCCLDGITVSAAILQWPFALFGLAKLAGLRIRAGQLDEAAEMVGVALNHPATDPQVEHEAALRLELLRKLLPPERLEEGMRRGAARSLESIVAGIRALVGPEDG